MRSSSKISAAVVLLSALFLHAFPVDAAKAEGSNSDIYKQGINEAEATLLQKLSGLSAQSAERSALLFRLSALEFADDDYQKARLHLLEILEGGDTNAEPAHAARARRFLGLTEFNLGNFEQSIVEYDKALKLMDSVPQSERERLRILDGLNASLQQANKTERLLPGLRSEAELAQQLDSACDAGWAFLKLSDAEQSLGNKDDAERSLKRAVISFTRFFDAEKSAAVAPDVVPSDLWEALDRGPQRPPGGFWRANVSPAKAVVLCVHGLGLHSGYYSALGKALSERGIAVAALDVRGFGQWANTRLDRKIAIDSAVHDVVNMVRVLKRLNPGVPVFLLGESMGGAIVLRAAPEAEVTGVISSVPAADRYNALGTKMRLAWHVILAGNSDYNVSRVVVDKVSSDESLRESWENDRLARLQFAPTQLIAFDRFMKQNVRHAALVEKPVLITQGDKDELVKAESTIRLFRALASHQKSLLLIGPAEHLIFEAGQFDKLLIDGVVSWMGAMAHAEK